MKSLKLKFQLHTSNAFNQLKPSTEKRLPLNCYNEVNIRIG